MPLLWNEIKTRAVVFVLEWKNGQSVWEKAKARIFDIEFLKIFGVDQRKAPFGRRFISNVENKESLPQAEGYCRFHLEIFVYAGKQIPRTPSFTPQKGGELNLKGIKGKRRKKGKKV
jgi:hypothetical protein